MSTFTWSPAPGASEANEPRVRVSKFGDGYQQRVGDGINNQPRTWTLQFTGPTARTDEISAFLKARAGTESFDWTPPYGAAGKWICSSWSRAVIWNTVQGVSATFIEVFGE